MLIILDADKLQCFATLQDIPCQFLFWLTESKMSLMSVYCNVIHTDCYQSVPGTR